MQHRKQERRRIFSRGKQQGTESTDNSRAYPIGGWLGESSDLPACNYAHKQSGPCNDHAYQQEEQFHAFIVLLRGILVCVHLCTVLLSGYREKNVVDVLAAICQ